MDAGSENARGIHAIRCCKDKKDFTLHWLIDAAFDSYLPAFERSIPPLFRDFDAAPTDPTEDRSCASRSRCCATWDYRWARDLDADVARGLLRRRISRRSRAAAAAAHVVG